MVSSKSLQLKPLCAECYEHMPESSCMDTLIIKKTLIIAVLGSKLVLVCLVKEVKEN